MAQVNFTHSVTFPGTISGIAGPTVLGVYNGWNSNNGKGWWDCWLNTTLSTFGHPGGMFNGNANRGELYLQMDATGHIRARCQRFLNYVTPFSLAAFNDGNWHHAITMLDGNTLKCFVNAVLVGSFALPAENAIAGAPTWFIGSRPGSVFGFDGSITQCHSGVSFTDTAQDVADALCNGGTPPDVLSLAASVGVIVNAECPSLGPPIVAADLGKLNDSSGMTDLVVSVPLGTSTAFYPGPTDPTPTVDFCDVTVRLSIAVAGVVVEALTDVKSYFFADAAINAASQKAHNPDRAIRAVTDINGIAVLSIPTINNRRTGQAEDSWRVNIPQTKYSRRIQVPDAASAELADITID